MMRLKRSLVCVAAMFLLTACPKAQRPNAAGDDKPIVISGSSVLIFGIDMNGFQATSGGSPWVYQYSSPPSDARVLQVALKIPGDAPDWVVFDTPANFKMTVFHGPAARAVSFSSDANRANLKIEAVLESGDRDKWQQPMKRLLRYRGAPIKSIVLENVRPPSGQTICTGTGPFTCAVNTGLEQPVMKICVAPPGSPCS